jgi:hypothetical protein
MGWGPHLGVRRWATGLNLDVVHDHYFDLRDSSVSGLSPGSEPWYGHTGLLAQIHLTGWF